MKTPDQRAAMLIDQCILLAQANQIIGDKARMWVHIRRADKLIYYRINLEEKR